MRGRASPHYGQLLARDNPEAYKLWLTRNDEPEPEPAHGWSWQLASDDQQPIARDFCRRLLEMTALTDTESAVVWLLVFDGSTLQEAGDELGFSRERIRQAMKSAVRKMQKSASKLTGVPTAHIAHFSMQYERRPMYRFWRD
jgi:DNA-directed RNA polymerase specialized sigma24 family protein